MAEQNNLYFPLYLYFCIRQEGYHDFHSVTSSGIPPGYMYILVRGPGAEPGKGVQSFFLNVFMLYRYCTL